MHFATVLHRIWCCVPCWVCRKARRKVKQKKNETQANTRQQQCSKCFSSSVSVFMFYLAHTVKWWSSDACASSIVPCCAVLVVFGFASCVLAALRNSTHNVSCKCVVPVCVRVEKRKKGNILCVCPLQSFLDVLCAKRCAYAWHHWKQSGSSVGEWRFVLHTQREEKVQKWS